MKNMRQGKGGGPSKTRKGPTGKEPSSTNPFDILGEEGGEGVTFGVKGDHEQLTRKIKKMEKKEELQTSMEGMEEDVVEEIELGELGLDAIEAEFRKKGKGYVSRRQIELLQEAIIKAGAHPNLGVDLDPLTGHKQKPLEEEQRRGRKSNKQRIVEIGVKLIKSGQYLTIRAVFSEVSKVSQ